MPQRENSFSRVFVDSCERSNSMSRYRHLGINERPQATNDRSEPGHWEADTVAGQTGSSCLITLTCRKSRLLLSLRIPGKISAHVRDGMIRLLGALPPEPVRPVTPDRGKECAQKRRNLRCTEQRSFFLSSASRALDARDEREHQWAHS